MIYTKTRNNHCNPFLFLMMLPASEGDTLQALSIKKILPQPQFATV
jgi:hypothetical protein